MPKTNTSELIGTREACDLLDIDKSTLSRWVAKGYLKPAMRLGSSPNSAMLFRRDDIDALVDAA